MKRRAVIISLLLSSVGLVGMKSVSHPDRVVYWPKNQHKQDRIIADQWRGHYRIKEIFANETAGFEHVA